MAPIDVVDLGIARLSLQHCSLLRSQFGIQEKHMYILIVIELSLKWILRDDVLDLRDSPNHDRYIKTKLLENRVMDLFRKNAIVHLLSLKHQITAVYVAFHIFKTELRKRLSKRVHFDHVVAPDIYPAEQGCVFHKLDRRSVDNEPVMNVALDCPVVGFLDAGGRDHFNIRRNVMVSTEIEHLLSFRNTTDQ
jgi:hypothetical protein